MTTTYPTSRLASSIAIQPFPRPDFASMTVTALNRYFRHNACYITEADAHLRRCVPEERCQLANLVFDRRAKAFAAFLAERQRLDAILADASADVNRFPKGDMGLTPDAVKFSAPFRAAAKRYDAAHAAVRALNGQYVTHFKEELRHISLQRRAANLKPI